MIDGLSEEQIRRQVVPGKWSIFENIVHLQTYQHTFIIRVREILEKDSPVFSRYSAEADPEFLEYCEKSTREVMHDFITIRKQLTSEITHFNESDFKRTGVHPAYGVMNLSQWLNFFLLHEAHHLFTIFKLSGELRRTS